MDAHRVALCKFEYLGEIEKEIENALAFLSGAQMGSNHEKNGVRKSRDTLPLIVRVIFNVIAFSLT